VHRELLRHNLLPILLELDVDTMLLELAAGVGSVAVPQETLVSPRPVAVPQKAWALASASLEYSPR